jgi:ribosomal protein L30/L7E
MARIVAEIMNRELFSVRPDDRAEVVLDAILAYGITAVPVLDDERRPLGVVSLRDLVDPERRSPISSPAATVLQSASVEEAARALGVTSFHHLVVVDEEGRAVGMVSAVDLVRGLVGLPARHPAAFPHWDEELRVSWSDDTPLDVEHIARAPREPGVFVLVSGGVGQFETDVWAEGTNGVRGRLLELLGSPQEPALGAVLAHGALRYRTAIVLDSVKREAMVTRIRDRTGHLPAPQRKVLD